MALFSLWIPVIATILGLLYLAFLSKYVGGFKDELFVVGVIILLWVLYPLSNIVNNLTTTLFGNPLSLLVIFLGVIAILLVYNRFSPLKKKLSKKVRF